MKVYLVQAQHESYEITYGVATTPEKAIEIVHSLQAFREAEGEESGHIAVHELEMDKFLPEGA